MEIASFKLGEYTIQVFEGPYLEDGEPTDAAHEFAATVIGLLDSARIFAAKEYLALYNDRWRRNGEPVLDERQFRSRLTNPAILLFDQIGSATIGFDDSNMLAGHWIEVSVDNGEITYADICG
jgi:hypothetical protein